MWKGEVKNRGEVGNVVVSKSEKWLAFPLLCWGLMYN